MQHLSSERLMKWMTRVSIGMILMKMYLLKVLSTMIQNQQVFPWFSSLIQSSTLQQLAVD